MLEIQKHIVNVPRTHLRAIFVRTTGTTQTCRETNHEHFAGPKFQFWVPHTKEASENKNSAQFSSPFFVRTTTQTYRETSMFRGFLVPCTRLLSKSGLVHKHTVPGIVKNIVAVFTPISVRQSSIPKQKHTCTVKHTP